MKTVGAVLMVIGALIGSAVGLGMAVGVELPGVSWLIAAGIVKLTLLAAFGLIGAGATLIRLARRAEQRQGT